jgi:hypothetical protein
MTEQEWLTSKEPRKMLTFLLDQPDLRSSDRKLRLFTCAICRRLWPRLPYTDERTLAGLEVAERDVEGQATRDELSGAYQAAALAAEHMALWEAYPPPWPDKGTLHGYAATSEAVYYLSSGLIPQSKIRWRYPDTSDFAYRLTSGASVPIEPLSRESAALQRYPASAIAACRALDAAASEGVENHQTVILHEIFGNPFRLIHIDPALLAWQDGTVVKLAQAIYDERRFQDMTILADALEEAGCDNADVLSHSRGPGPHVRGCWTLDLLTGKA